MENLIRIQKELKAPKDKLNKFGNYKYRSCESILEAVKPLLKGCLLLLSDEVKNIGTKNYVVATATFIETDGKQFIVTAYAREPEDRKGMDDSQITGASSSYARKYALNGLFAIDDNQDSDVPQSQNPDKNPLPKLERSMTAKWQNAVKALKDGKTIDDIEKVYCLDDETRKQLADDLLA
jgi:hypothetical protein